MDKSLPRVVVVGSVPNAITSIELLVGDLCRIERYGISSIRCDEMALFPLPDLILVSFDAVVPDPLGVGRRIWDEFPAVEIPALYVLMAGDVACDDGFPLSPCLVTPSRPAEFRAAIESRLGRHSPQFQGIDSNA